MNHRGKGALPELQYLLAYDIYLLTTKFTILPGT